MLFAFLSNLLEPFSYLVFFVALFIQTFITREFGVKVLMVHYAICTVLMAYASHKAFQQSDNRWIYNVIALLSAVNICLYFHLWFRSTRRRAIIKILLAVNVLYFLVNAIVLRQFYIFDSLGHALLALTVVVLAFLYFHHAFGRTAAVLAWREFNFFLVTGYLFYYLVSFVIFLTYHNLTDRILQTYTSRERDLLTWLWVVQNVLLFLSALIVLTGSVWIAYRNRSSKSS